MGTMQRRIFFQLTCSRSFHNRAAIFHNFENLHNEMKQIEQESRLVPTISNEDSFIVRLDGSNFGTFTKSYPAFSKPFDPRGGNILFRNSI